MYIKHPLLIIMGSFFKCDLSNNYNFLNYDIYYFIFIFLYKWKLARLFHKFCSIFSCAGIRKKKKQESAKSFADL